MDRLSSPLAVLLGIAVSVTGSCAYGAFEWSGDGQLRLSWDAQPILQYNRATVQPPEGVDAAFARNAYIHPVWSLTGEIVTDDFPADHYHQRGLFLAWTKTEFGDLQPDFWNLKKLSGRIVCESVEEPVATANEASLVARHLWQAHRGEEWVRFQIRAVVLRSWDHGRH